MEASPDEYDRAIRAFYVTRAKAIRAAGRMLVVAHERGEPLSSFLWSDGIVRVDGLDIDPHTAIDVCGASLKRRQAARKALPSMLR